MESAIDANEIENSAADVAPASRRRRKRKHVSGSPQKPDTDIDLSDSKSEAGEERTMAQDGSVQGLPDVDQLEAEQPEDDQPSTLNDQPAVYQPAVYQPAVYQPAVYQPAVYQPAVYQPAVYQPAVYQPAVDQLAVDQLEAEQPEEDQLSTLNDRPAIDLPAVDQPEAEQPKDDQPITIDGADAQSEPQSVPETTMSDSEYSLLPIEKEYERIKGLEHGDKIIRWLGRPMGPDNPLDAGQDVITEWQELQHEIISISEFFRPGCCSWEDISDVHREWLATWIPESQARLEVGSVLFWITASIRLLWEQLLSPDKPGDLWLGPHWEAFGKIESELRTFEADGDKKEPLFQHSSLLYRHARWQYYRFLYTLHGIHKDVELLKRRLCEAISPVLVDDEQRLVEMDTFLTTVLDLFIRLDMHVHSSAQDIRFDWSDPKTSCSTGFMWREDNKLMKMRTFVDKATKWPVSYISRPLVRVYGRGHYVTDGEFIKRPRMGRYHRLAQFDPMTVCGMPGDSREAFDMLEKDVPGDNMPEADMMEKDVAAENVLEENMLEEDSEEDSKDDSEEDSEDDSEEKKEEYSEESEEESKEDSDEDSEEEPEEETQDYVPNEDMSGEQRPEERSNEMFDRRRMTRSMSRTITGK